MTSHLIGDPFFARIGLDPYRRDCFFCTLPLTALTGGIVVWHGAAEQPLCLHQGCAEALAVRLIQDAGTARLQTVQIIKLHPSAPQPNPRPYRLVPLK